jgi:hypothetical protein
MHLITSAIGTLLDIPTTPKKSACEAGSKLSGAWPWAPTFASPCPLLLRRIRGFARIINHSGMRSWRTSAGAARASRHDPINHSLTSIPNVTSTRTPYPFPWAEHNLLLRFKVQLVAPNDG